MWFVAAQHVRLNTFGRSAELQTVSQAPAKTFVTTRTLGGEPASTWAKVWEQNSPSDANDPCEQTAPLFALFDDVAAEASLPHRAGSAVGRRRLARPRRR